MWCPRKIALYTRSRRIILLVPLCTHREHGDDCAATASACVLLYNLCPLLSYHLLCKLCSSFHSAVLVAVAMAAEMFATREEFYLKLLPYIQQQQQHTGEDSLRLCLCLCLLLPAAAAAILSYSQIHTLRRLPLMMANFKP